MNRRALITLLGGAAAWPFVARAQQSERMRRIGVLLPGTRGDAEFDAWLGAFLQGLGLAGWSIGKNLRTTAAALDPHSSCSPEAPIW